MPIDNAHIRHQNFMVLYQRFKDVNSHLPERGMLKMFADHIGFSDRYLSHIKCNRKNIGNNVARNIEASLGLVHGWMDREHARAKTQDEDGDEGEKLFLETAKTLYRCDPEAARHAIMNLLRARLLPSMA
jgi:hypothetical protein